MEKTTQEKVDAIIDDLCDRSGFDDWWHDIDEETQREIKESIINIIDDVE